MLRLLKGVLSNAFSLGTRAKYPLLLAHNSNPETVKYSFSSALVDDGFGASRSCTVKVEEHGRRTKSASPPPPPFSEEVRPLSLEEETD